MSTSQFSLCRPTVIHYRIFYPAWAKTNKPLTRLAYTRAGFILRWICQGSSSYRPRSERKQTYQILLLHKVPVFAFRNSTSILVLLPIMFAPPPPHPPCRFIQNNDPVNILSSLSHSWPFRENVFQKVGSGDSIGHAFLFFELITRSFSRGLSRVPFLRARHAFFLLGLITHSLP